MHTFAQKLFFMFGLRRRTATRRTPAALQVDYSNVIPMRRASDLRIVTERRDGFVYVKPRADDPEAEVVRGWFTRRNEGAAS